MSAVGTLRPAFNPRFEVIRAIIMLEDSQYMRCTKKSSAHRAALTDERAGGLEVGGVVGQLVRLAPRTATVSKR